MSVRTTPRRGPGAESTATEVVAGHDLAGKETIVTGGRRPASWAAVADELDGASGQYLEDCAVAAPWTGPGDPPRRHYLPYARDMQNARRLWELSERLVAGVRS